MSVYKVENDECGRENFYNVIIMVYKEKWCDESDVKGNLLSECVF